MMNNSKSLSSWIVGVTLALLAICAPVSAGPLYSVNTQVAELANLPEVDLVTWHVNCADPKLERWRDFDKPLVISDDGSAADPAMINGWGCPAPLFERLFLAVTDRGWGYEHLSNRSWYTSWQGHRPITSLGDFDIRAPRDGSSYPLALEFDVYSNRFYGKNYPPNGTLERRGSGLFYGGKRLQIRGFSNYGAIGDPNVRISLESLWTSSGSGTWLDFLHHVGTSWTRVFLLDQFGANRFRNPDAPRGLTPWRYSNGKYDLTKFDQAFFSRLTDFVSAADQRGIVVQLALFERWQLRNVNDVPLARYSASPYNPSNNVNRLGDRSVSRDSYPQSILDTQGPMWAAHRAYLAKVAESVLAAQGAGRNVAFEVMNEGDFGRWPVARRVAFARAVIAEMKRLMGGGAPGPPPGSPMPPPGTPTRPVPPVANEGHAEALRQATAAVRLLDRDRVRPRHERRAINRLRAALVALEGGG